jgi:hypothetical protein
MLVFCILVQLPFLDNYVTSDIFGADMVCLCTLLLSCGLFAAELYQLCLKKLRGLMAILVLCVMVQSKAHFGSDRIVPVGTWDSQK